MLRTVSIIFKGNNLFHVIVDSCTVSEDGVSVAVPVQHTRKMAVMQDLLERIRAESLFRKDKNGTVIRSQMNRARNAILARLQSPMSKKQ